MKKLGMMFTMYRDEGDNGIGFAVPKRLEVPVISYGESYDELVAMYGDDMQNIAESLCNLMGYERVGDIDFYAPNGDDDGIDFYDDED